MTEYCFPNKNTTINTNNKNKFSDFTILLYFSYLIFFSPYLFKLLSFLSPLFFTTFLLFLSLFTTIIPLHSIINNSKEGFFLTAYNTLLENLRPRFDNDEDGNSQPLEEFEVYKVVFDIPTIELSEENPVESQSFGENPEEFSVEKVHKDEEESVNQRESLTEELETGDTKPKKVEEEEEEEEVKKQDPIIKRSGSEAIEVKKTTKFGSLRVNDGKNFSDAFSQTVGAQHCLGSSGSMRKEKEWRRTLACKLFEERHNWSNNKIGVNGGESEEGMDLLWESYETEPNRGQQKAQDNKKGRRREKIEDLVKNDDEDEDECEDDDEISKICCLQALKLSAGKMNLSMGRPNFVKFSKAFKGIGWLQSHVRRQGKKGYK